MGYRGDDANDLKHAVATASERLSWLRSEERDAPGRIASMQAQIDGMRKRLPELHGDIAQQESLLRSLQTRFEKTVMEERLVKQIRDARQKLEHLKRG